MKNKNQKDPSIDELIAVANQLVLLIEDNNQNTKDCVKLLKLIQQKVCPKSPSTISRLVSKILNTK